MLLNWVETKKNDELMASQSTHILEHLIVGLKNMIAAGYVITKPGPGSQGSVSVIFNSVRGCPKCGFNDGKYRYVESTNTIARACGRCDYKWSEAALDSVFDGPINAPAYDDTGKFFKRQTTIDCYGVPSGSDIGKVEQLRLLPDFQGD